MDVRCFRVRIKEGSLEAVREWAHTINSRREEALETLRDEAVVVESVFLESAADGNFLIYYLRSADFEAAQKVGKSSGHAIDECHRHFLRTHTDKGVPLDLLVDLAP